MTSFFHNVPSEAAQQIESLSSLSYDMREDRKRILAQYEVDDEAALLAAIVAGKVAEHPAYEHYLVARLLGETREALREQLRDVCVNGV
jgi:chromosome condensin MukBEF complex kleisin-like MukF subunit